MTKEKEFDLQDRHSVHKRRNDQEEEREIVLLPWILEIPCWILDIN